MELVDEGLQLAEVVRAVGVTHDDVAPADEWNGVDVGTAEAALGGAQHASTGGHGALRGAVARAVDDQDLAGDARLGEALAGTTSRTLRS